MDIVVCVKRVPETAEADIVIDETGKDIDTRGLVFDINEWDNYAVEEAVLLKEKYGGSVTVVSMGPQESNETLRRALAMGADEAIRLTDPAFSGSDGYAIARILGEAIRPLAYDLILTGVQAEDDGYGQVGPTLAEMLGIGHAAVVNMIERIDGGRARIHRELEGGLEEVLDLELPAVLTIQSGINEPRYVSIMGIRRVAKKEIRVLGLADLALKEDETGEQGSKSVVERVFLPPAGEGAQMLEGSVESLAESVVSILKEKGGLA
ncbi:MAG: electron transfer flavoprotein subunit beta/FixA family protein [Deltaproteobacteria bacterium]|nr:electron transfer flavoprotein subunit beta/FixA family protein [Deltaproteobacteria bacterium]MBW2120938.1 electron transfer flavoprotein subunit beta/FixA family protein [Deltaproteobacteria bacterium]